MTRIAVATIGFTNKSAETFFGLLRAAQVRTLLDVRLNKTSQLAGFAKKSDLRFFLSELLGAQYIELPELAPESEMLKRYRARDLSWDAYAQAYVDLLERRRVEDHLDRSLFEGGCLLCSEDRPHHCHRRLAAEYLDARWGGVLNVSHLF